MQTIAVFIVENDFLWETWKLRKIHRTVQQEAVFHLALSIFCPRFSLKVRPKAESVHKNDGHDRRFFPWRSYSSAYKSCSKIFLEQNTTICSLIILSLLTFFSLFLMISFERWSLFCRCFFFCNLSVASKLEIILHAAKRAIQNVDT